MEKKLNKKNKFNYKLKREDNEDKLGILKFSMCDDRFPLHNLQKEELKAFVSFAKIFEKLPWRTIKTYKGFKFESIANLVKPDNIEKDITLNSIRVSDKFRIIGYRQEQYFYIIWFDRNHLAYKG